MNGDAGIGTLTTTASAMGTLPSRHPAEDSGTGSLDATPDNTQKRAPSMSSGPPKPSVPPPKPAGPPPPRKPLKNNRRRSSTQSAAGLGGNEERKSYYDNVSASSSQNEPDTRSNSSVHAIAGSVDSLDSRRSNSVQSDFSCSGHPTPERIQSALYKDKQTPSPVSRKHSGSGSVSSPAVKDSTIQPHRNSSSTTRSFAVGVDTGKNIDRFSVGSANEESSVTYPVILPKPQLPKKSFDNQV